jgi:nitroreductase
MIDNEILKGILTRRSVREYSEEAPSDELVKAILEAGIWAPSGVNNQPWRFIVVRDPETKDKISELTHYSRIVKAAPVLICVFMDLEASYHREKDIMAMGACNENMLLAAHSLGLGGVWLGEILKSKEEIRNMLDAPRTWELTSVLAIGHPSPRVRKSTRRPILEVAYKERFGESFRG